ncbi:MAG: plasmid mobilization relaxosome protein MobC [Henriciella sp.]
MRYADGLAATGEQQKTKTPPPFSLRLTREERARLEAQAGSQPLGAYIRSRLLGQNTSKRRRSRRPRIDETMAARLLGELGKSRISSNLNQLARAANMGTLDLDPETVQELQEACEAVREMRAALIAALGVKSEGS